MHDSKSFQESGVRNRVMERSGKAYLSLTCLPRGQSASIMKRVAKIEKPAGDVSDKPSNLLFGC